MNKSIFSFFFCSLLLVSVTLKAQMTDPDGCTMPVNTLPAGMQEQKTVPALGDKAYTIRALSEINKVDTAEAYPCLSPDGLRLYFIQGVAGNSAIKVASRTGITALFGSPVILSNGFPNDGLKGCWISGDETEIYYVNNDIVYYASRPGLSDPFSMPAVMSMSGSISGALFGPSLSPDGQELFISNSGTSKQILILERSGSTSFVLTDTLDIPAGYTSGVGQFSRDGLQYIVSLTSSSTLRTALYRYERTALGDVFSVSTVSALDTAVNNVNWSSNTHPTLTADGMVLAWVRNACGTVWADNDLYLATDAAAGACCGETISSMQVSPNPTQGWVTVQFHEVPRKGEVLLVLDALGRLRMRVPVQGSVCRLDLSALLAGSYYLVLEGNPALLSRVVLR